VKLFTAFFVSSALLASTCVADVHWTYHPSVHTVDGPSGAYVTAKFRTGELRYAPPMKWALSDSRFIPPGKVEADAYVVAVPIRAPAPWTPDRAKALHAAALSQSVPKGATGAAVLSEGVLPVLIDGQSAYEICLSYSYYGQVFSESTVYVEHGNTQLQFHLGCLQNDFSTLHAAFLGSLLSVAGF